MPIAHEHDLHRRRYGRNMGVMLTLAAFVALVFGLTIAKAQRGESVEAFDHSYRSSIDTTLPSATQGDR